MKDTLQIVRKHGNGCSWYEDKNGILKGEWGGLVEEEKYYNIYYSKFHGYVPITKYGFFYNKFDCRKYDGVIHIVDSYYITEKNNRFGIVDENEKVILHNTYNSIYHVKNRSDIIFIVSTETGKFLCNLSMRSESDVYDDVLVYTQENFIYKKDDKYGILCKSGKEVLSAEYEYNKYSDDWRRRLYLNFKGKFCRIYLEKNLLYGMFETNLSTSYYELCVDSFNGIFIYITYKDGKYGLINDRGIVIEENILEDIIPHNTTSTSGPLFEYISFGTKNKNYRLVFIAAKKNGKYCVYESIGNRCLIENCDKVSYFGFFQGRNPKGYYDSISFEKDGKLGYITYGGMVLDYTKYESITLCGYFYHVKQKGKCGVLYGHGETLIPCMYDKIEQKNNYEFILTKDGKTSFFDRTSPTSSSPSLYEAQHYDRYGGAYGYSDEDIDTIFDGDPDAYWNID